MKTYVEVDFARDVGLLAFWPTSDKSGSLRGSYPFVSDSITSSETEMQTRSDVIGSPAY